MTTWKQLLKAAKENGTLLPYDCVCGSAMYQDYDDVRCIGCNGRVNNCVCRKAWR